MSKLDRLGWAVSQSYRFGESDVTIRTTSRDFATWMQEVFSEYCVDHDADPMYSIVVSGGSKNGGGVRGYHILYRGIVPLVRTLHLPTLAVGLIAELETSNFHERDDAVYLRSATVEVNGVTALISAFLSAQLGTLGRQVQRAGATLPVTDFTAVNHDGLVVPIRSALDIPKGAIAALPGAGSSGRNGKADRLILDDERSVDAVLLSPGAQLVEPVSRGTALARLASSASNLGVMGRAGLESLGRLVSGARCYEIGGGEASMQLKALGMAVGGDQTAA